MIHKESETNNIELLRNLSGILNRAAKDSISGDSSPSNGFNEWVYRVRERYRGERGDNTLKEVMSEMCVELFEELPELYFDSSAAYELSFLVCE